MNQVGYAKQQATKIFTTVGVRIEWQMSRSCQALPDEVKMSFQAQTQQELRPGALGYAFLMGRATLSSCMTGLPRQPPPTTLLQTVSWHS